MRALVIPCALLALNGGLASANPVYKCVDAQGTIHYADKPCTDKPPEPPLRTGVAELPPEAQRVDGSISVYGWESDKTRKFPKVGVEKPKPIAKPAAVKETRIGEASAEPGAAPGTASTPASTNGSTSASISASAGADAAPADAPPSAAPADVAPLEAAPASASPAADAPPAAEAPPAATP